MNTQATVGQLVAERPARARVFEQFGFDYCCGGKTPLEQACREKNVDLPQILAALEAADAAVIASPPHDWTRATLTQLANHIEEVHHAYLKRELPRLDHLTQRVLNAHGRQHPELGRLREVFMAFKTEMDQHMVKEERMLFPMCRQLDVAVASQGVRAMSVSHPIRVMIQEHDQAGGELATMRTLTQGYTPPQGACNTYRAMLSSLAELEVDTHQHVHKENNILFPKALEREAAA